MRKLILLVLLSYCCFSFAATITSMTKEETSKAFINKTMVSIATDNLNRKTINNTFGMFLDNHGNIFGKMSLKPGNEPQTDKGSYSINSNGSMYIRWQHWDNKQQLCANYFATQNAIIAVSCDGIFHTVFMKSDIKNGNQL